MVQNVNKLATQAQQQIDEVDQMLRVLRGWLDRADRLVHQAGDLIEGPIFTGARILNGLGTLVTSCGSQGMVKPRAGIRQRPLTKMKMNENAESNERRRKQLRLASTSGGRVLLHLLALAPTTGGGGTWRGVAREPRVSKRLEDPNDDY